MRRFIYWYLPLAASLLALAVFAAGFAAYLRGDLGRPVDPAPMRVTVAPSIPGGTIAPLILGDSLARGIGDETGLGIGGRLAEELRKRGLTVRPPVNIAVSGERCEDLLKQLDHRSVRALIAESNAIVISIGGNDLWGGTEFRNGPPPNPDAVMNDVLERVVRIVTIVRDSNRNARIYLLGLYNPFASMPFGSRLSLFVARWNAKLLERFASDGNVVIVPIADLFAYRDRLSFDRFHPKDEGYALIAKRIAETM